MRFRSAVVAGPAGAGTGIEPGTGAVSGARPGAALSDGGPPNRGLIVVSIMLATIMQALDMTIANVALPHMQGSMEATQEQLSWVLTYYIVAAALMTAPHGMLAARFGDRKSR